MSFGIVAGSYLPWGPFGSTFWGGFWAPPPGLNPGVSDITGESSLTAIAIDYDSIALDWDQPTESFDLYVIVRSATGFPLTLTEGDVVVVGQRADNITNYVDSNVAPGYAYYSMFIRLSNATPAWTRISQAYVLMPTNNQSGQWLYDLLPDWYHFEDEKTAGHPTSSDMAAWGQLRRFMELLGRSYDGLRAEADALLNVYDARKSRADLLEYFAAMYGFLYEPHIGYAQMRSIMANWFEILKSKGTMPGTELFVESTMGYTSTIVLGQYNSRFNMMLTTNDSDAAQTNGQWVLDSSGLFGARAGTISRVTPGTPYLATVTTAHQLTTTNTDPAMFVCGDATSATNVKLTGIPVVGSTQYQMQVAFRAVSVLSSTPQLYVRWYTSAGVYISSSQSAGTLFDQNAWVVSSFTPTAPSNAAYALPQVAFNPVASDKIAMFTGVMFNVKITSGVPTYQSARALRIAMHPTRVNFLPNPSFESTTVESYLNAVDIFGSGQQYATTPDFAALSAIVGDMEISAKVQLTNWTPGSNSMIVAKYDGGTNQGSWAFYVGTDKKLYFGVTPDGTHASVVTQASDVLPFNNGDTKWVRVTYDSDDGGGNRVASFFWSDDGVGWTAVGVRTTAPNTAIFDSSALLSVGRATNFGGSNLIFSGKIYKVEVRDGIGGTVVASPDFSTGSPFVDAQSNQWTITGTTSASLIVDPKLFFKAQPTVYVQRSSEQHNPVAGGTWSAKVTLAPGTTSVMVDSANISFTVFLGTVLIPSFVVGDVWTFMMTIYPAQTPAGEIVYPYIKTYNKDEDASIRAADVTSPNLGLGWAQMLIDVEITESMLTSGSPYFSCGVAITNAPSNGPSYYIDATSLERNAHVYQYSYFDGSSDLTSEDFAWSGEVHNSPSMYFPNKRVRRSRLDSTLPDFLPPLTPYLLAYELPTT